MSVVADGRKMLSNVISSQIDIHTLYGGVVPEIASRHHLENINGVIDESLSEAGVTLDDIDLIGVTNGPGLIGAVVIGVATAKAISFAKDIPLVGVNHMHGHVSANYIQYPDLEPPFISLVVSGGHTQIIKVTDYNKCEVIGATRDDAAGEAFDKVARVIGLGYPGGPKVDRAAKSGDPDAIQFKRVWLEKGSYDFSFSGLKTQALNYINQERMQGHEIPVNDIAASYQAAILDVIIQKSIQAALEFGQAPGMNKAESIQAAAGLTREPDVSKAESVQAAAGLTREPGVSKACKPKLVVAGGVAANSALREGLAQAATENGIDLYMPDPVLCTDNGAMIGAAAYYKYRACGPDPLTLDAYADLEM
ncbi:MAG: tRNA (adenosine(37)-N6)-threonylcarbamoyltransferase complex transferase subunit TsaD [Eubacterium sp.]|nr:tRNA (adenosine(37)-N6)-threonylcarbamoyltransferase complex transferase subunit TsaD [Eubacterium sp.]